jgi:hypothetical protein
VNLRKKIGCLLPFGIRPVIELAFCDLFTPLRGGITILLTPLLSRKLVIASSLVWLVLKACFVG